MQNLKMVFRVLLNLSRLALLLYTLLPSKANCPLLSYFSRVELSKYYR